jgi:hypothetical protein
MLTRQMRRKLEEEAWKIELRVWEINCWGDSNEKYIEKPELIKKAVEVYEKLGEEFPHFFGY